MLTLIVVIFIIGYLAIAFEDWLQFNKTATALLTGILCWTVYAVSKNESVSAELAHHFVGIAEILFFLLGAMTIVELIDAHDGFEIITQKINTQNPKKLLWIICFTAFFLSAVLDNLTTSIVMMSLLRKIVPDKQLRKVLAAMVVVAANAGGAWSPIGDVTTTMLWVGGQVSTSAVVSKLFLPSLISLIVPVLIIQFQPIFGSNSQIPNSQIPNPNSQNQSLMLFFGVGGLLFVPVFKLLTHLPPYMGMLLALGMIWAVSEFIHKDKDEEQRQPYTAAQALSRIDSSSILFFLGILLAIACLESTHLLSDLSIWLNDTFKNLNLIVLLIGLASAVIDNVPLVAATIGMYGFTSYPIDHTLWLFLAYCAGTGGSILIIGSAAGVAVMGMEKINFGWYLRKLSGLTLVGYLVGALVYVLLFQ